MTMKNKDTLLQEKKEILQRISKSVKDGDDAGFTQAFSDLCGNIEKNVLSEAREMVNINDVTVLAQRNYHQLTSAEQKFYTSLIDASKSDDVKQALKDIIMPETIFDSVFDDLQTNHPLLSEIDFQNTTGLTRFFTSKNGEQKAIWGKLTSKIVQELTASFIEKDMSLMKLSAFIPVSQDMVALGPQYIDKYIRTILYEAMANALEDAIVCGDGNDKIIGMDRYVGDDVSVTAGVYPEKEKIKIDSFTPENVGKIVSLIATDSAGKPRTVSNLALLVNPQDYYNKVMPATTVMAPDGTYRNDVMPVPMKIIQTIALPKGKAVIGMLKKMFVGVGMSKDGKIEYSDEYQFLEDNRVYKDKLYANGFPRDNNAFQILDISDLQPKHLVVESKQPHESSNDATLVNLSLGSAALSPVFTKDTKSYTATTANATNTVTAVPSDASSDIIVKVNDIEISNGSAATWKDGENTVTIEITNGTGKDTYTVTLTKTVE